MACQIAEALKAGLPRAQLTKELRGILISQCAFCHCRIDEVETEDPSTNRFAGMPAMPSADYDRLGPDAGSQATIESTPHEGRS